MEHTCMSAIYYDQGSDIKAKQCKTIVTFDTIPESKILDTGDLLILLNLQKPWTIACKDISRAFEIEYSTYRILNRSELCECSLTAGNYLLSYTNINCGNVLEVRDGYFTTYYSFNKIVLDVITEKFDIQVEKNTKNKAALLHDDILGYDLPTINFVNMTTEQDEDVSILEEDNSQIYAYLDDVSVQVDQIGRTYPPLFNLNLPKEEEIIDNLREITMMEYVVQIIMIIVCIAIVLIIMYFCCTKCRHTRTIFKYCFPFLPILRIVHTLRRTDLFVEVTNITKGNGVWAHFVSTGCFPMQIQLSRPIQKDDVQIETVCCIFKQIRIDWSSIIVTGISGTIINIPDTAFVSIFMDNDLAHITDDHFEIKLIARLLDQMYVLPPPAFPPRYDDTPPSAPQFPEHLHSLLTRS